MIKKYIKSLIQMLYEFKKMFIELLILVVITKCLSSVNPDNILSSTVSSVFHKETFLTPKIGNEQETSLRHVGQMSLIKDNDTGNKNRENDRNQEIVQEYRKVGRMNRQGPKIWDQWGSWSSCSVTCGVGKLTRWRHCIDGNCAVGEKKAQLKTCTLSAC